MTAYEKQVQEIRKFFRTENGLSAGEKQVAMAYASHLEQAAVNLLGAYQVETKWTEKKAYQIKLAAMKALVIMTEIAVDNMKEPNEKT